MALSLKRYDLSFRNYKPVKFKKKIVVEKLAFPVENGEMCNWFNK